MAEAQTWPEKLGPLPDRDPNGAKPQAKGQLVVGPAYLHRMRQRQASTWQCEACGQSTKSKRRAEGMQWLPCKGAVLKRAASSAGPAGSTADQAWPIVFW